jgi:hypothetical protein
LARKPIGLAIDTSRSSIGAALPGPIAHHLTRAARLARHCCRRLADDSLSGNADVPALRP